MKTRYFFASIVHLVLIACSENPKDMEACSIQVPTFTFDHSLHGACGSAKVDENGKIVFFSGPKSDYFNAANGKTRYANAPILLKDIDNTQPFTFTARLSPAFDKIYDAEPYISTRMTCIGKSLPSKWTKKA